MESRAVPDTTPDELADDILHGADEIAEFIFGARGSRRKVYYLAECTRLPVFRLGSMLCARKSVLLQWISRQENQVLRQAN
ncbi:MAG TPA: DNA-binding protein [Pseudolabrys sp.]|nr:DNA-binding protein [Pseudolabrys sp.]